MNKYIRTFTNAYTNIYINTHMDNKMPEMNLYIYMFPTGDPTHRKYELISLSLSTYIYVYIYIYIYIQFTDKITVFVTFLFFGGTKVRLLGGGNS